LGYGKGEEGSWLNWQGCFACGKENPWGLKLDFKRRGEKVWAEVVFHENYSGYPGIIHGGIVTTVLDEAMAKALLFRGIAALTVELRVRFRKKAAPGMTYIAEGWIEGERKNLFSTAAWLLYNQEVVAEAKGRFLKVKL